MALARGAPAGWLRRDVRALIAGLVSGFLVLGLGGRLAMTLVALLGGTRPRFSFAGSLEVVLLGTLYGVLGGVVLAVIRRRWPRVALRGGLALGALLCGIAWLTSVVGRQTASASPVAVPVLVGVSVAIFGLYGGAAVWLAALHDRRADGSFGAPHERHQGWMS
jgi:hypothetical protein